MTKNVKRFFSMLLALSMVFSLVVPAAATETEHDHAHVEETAEETTEETAPVVPENPETGDTYTAAVAITAFVSLLGSALIVSKKFRA